MKLKTPLDHDQIKAAKEIHVELRAWREAVSALRALAAAFPGFNADATLLKVAAVNTLYGTNRSTPLTLATPPTRSRADRPLDIYLDR